MATQIMPFRLLNSSTLSYSFNLLMKSSPSLPSQIYELSNYGYIGDKIFGLVSSVIFVSFSFSGKYSSNHLQFIFLNKEVFKNWHYNFWIFTWCLHQTCHVKKGCRTQFKDETHVFVRSNLQHKRTVHNLPNWAFIHLSTF